MDGPSSPRASLMLEGVSNLLRYIPSNDIPTSYTVVLRGEEFKLTKNQIEFDSPNYFTSAFLGDFRESITRTISLDRNPVLFRIIVEYLSGYEILPLDVAALPLAMGPYAAIKNLALDAGFYGLTHLQSILTTPVSPGVHLEGFGICGQQIVLLEQVVGENLPEGVEYIEGGLFSDVNGSQQPVMVFAKDMPIRFVYHSDNPSGYRKRQTVRYHLDYRPSNANIISGSIKHPPTIIADAFEDCVLHIDDNFHGKLAEFNTYSQGDASEQVNSIFRAIYPRERNHNAPIDHVEITLWADELLFTVTRRGTDAGDPTLHVKLLNVKARTRAAIVDSLSPPCSRWAYDHRKSA